MAFSYYKTVTIAHGQVPSNLTDFPVSIWVTDADFKTVGNSGFVQNASGYDIRPYSDSSLTIPLTYELVPATYVATTGAFEMHVKIPTVSSLSDTIFYLAVGDSGISTDGSSTATWTSNYTSVWHLPNGTSLTTNDSTANALNLIAALGFNLPTAAAGNLDGGATFNGSNTGLRYDAGVDHTEWWNILVFTLSAWVKTSATGAVQDVITRDEGSTRCWQFRVEDTGGIRFYAGYNGSFDITGGSNIEDGNWHLMHAVASNAGKTGTIYLDGSQVGTNTSGTALQLGNWIPELYIGLNQASSGSGFFNGTIDEPRFLSTALVADWITAEYNNQKPSSTFLTYGALTPVAAGKRFFLIPS